MQSQKFINNNNLDNYSSQNHFPLALRTDMNNNNCMNNNNNTNYYSSPSEPTSNRASSTGSVTGKSQLNDSFSNNDQVFLPSAMNNKSDYCNYKLQNQLKSNGSNNNPLLHLSNINNSNNNNNNNFYLPNLSNTSEECYESCCYMIPPSASSTYSSIYNDVNNLNECTLSDNSNDMNSIYSNSFLNFFSNINQLTYAPTYYQNYFQQQKCDTPPPITTKTLNQFGAGQSAQICVTIISHFS